MLCVICASVKLAICGFRRRISSADMPFIAAAFALSTDGSMLIVACRNWSEEMLSRGLPPPLPVEGACGVVAVAVPPPPTPIRMACCRSDSLMFFICSVAAFIMAGLFATCSIWLMACQICTSLMFAIAGFVALIPAGPMALIAAACCFSCAGSMAAMRSAPSRSAEVFVPSRLMFVSAPLLRPPAAVLDVFLGGGSDCSFALATNLATSSGLPTMSPSIFRRSSLSGG
mmetsp:Transcript_15760/g.36304  ORF Transcript_15760/g.36304 Transcript_15760/m.36304 type:complete len:229 (-) Transcript_15760:268-954(-)